MLAVPIDEKCLHPGLLRSRDIVRRVVADEETLTGMYLEFLGQPEERSRVGLRNSDPLRGAHRVDEFEKADCTELVDLLLLCAIRQHPDSVPGLPKRSEDSDGVIERSPGCPVEPQVVGEERIEGVDFTGD